MLTVKKIRLVNPGRKKVRKQAKSRRNAPKRSHQKNMARTKKAGKRRAAKKPRARKGNPFFGKKVKHRKRTKPVMNSRRRRGRRSNPHFGHRRRRAKNPRDLKSAGLWLWRGVEALGGLVLTRQIPQWLLKEKNEGWMGYAANAAVALAAAWAAHKFAGPQDALAVGIGGSMYLANRIIQEKLSPVGAVLSLSGLGDAMAWGAGSSLNGLEDAYFPVPVTYDADGNAILPSLITDTINSSVAAAIPAGGGNAPTMSALRGMGRFR